MTTLRDLYKAKGWTLEDLRAHIRVKQGIGPTRPTIYKLIHHNGEEGEVKLKTVRAVCAVLGITLNDFEELEPYVYQAKKE